MASNPTEAGKTKDEKIVDEARKRPTAERLRAVLDYNPETGLFYWRRPASNAVCIGSRAGTLGHPSGYCFISVDGRTYAAHRLAWVYVYGEWPKELDHINRNRSDNRISNLRLCMDEFGNAQNRSKRGGGVRLHREGKWEARIGVRRKKIYLGLFDSRNMALAAYDQAAQAHFGEFYPR